MALTLHLRPHAVLQVLSRHVAGEVVENVAGLGGRRHAPEWQGRKELGSHGVLNLWETWW